MDTSDTKPSNLAPPFQKGGKGGPGRPKGSIAQSTLEVRAFCRSVVDHPAYRTKLFEDACARRLSPVVELMLWSRAYGEVPKTVVLEDVSSIDTHSLQQRLRQLVEAIDVLPSEAAEHRTNEPEE